MPTERDDRSGVVGDYTRRTPPGPDGLPVVGTLPAFVRNPLGYLERVAEYDDVVRLSFPRVDCVAAVHPEAVERVLMHDEDEFRRWNFEEVDPFGNFRPAPLGLASTDGERWRRQRRILQSVFGLDTLRSHADVIVDHTVSTANTWTDGEELVLDEVFSELSLAVLADSLLDLEGADRHRVVLNAADAMLERARIEGFVDVIQLLLPTWVPTPTLRRYRRALSRFESLVDELVAERRGEPGGHDDLLAAMLAAESEDSRGMSDAEIHDQVLTFLFAGHETAATALIFTWLLLATHPERRARLDAELDDVLGGEAPTVADLAALEYTEMVVREALRLYPPGPVLFREAATDTTLGGYRIPAGWKVFLPAHVIHRDGRWWADPDDFRPERWTPERDGERPEYAYFPFGGGPHHCIGMRFATMELKLAVATIAQRTEFELLSHPTPEVQLGVTLQPTEHVRARVRTRH